MRTLVLKNTSNMIRATSEDIDRGYKKCDDCDKVFIFNAGTDYPASAWIKCIRCDSWVVDLNKSDNYEV